MAGTPTITKTKAKKLTIRNMKDLGVYRKEYDKIIEIYSELLEQYAILTAQFMDGGCRCTTLTADGGEKKKPIVAALESLRKDILQYSDRLMLNPKAQSQPQGKGKDGEGKSLSDVLKELSG